MSNWILILNCSCRLKLEFKKFEFISIAEKSFHHCITKGFMNNIEDKTSLSNSVSYNGKNIKQNISY
jgi:hypothetical protein